MLHEPMLELGVGRDKLFSILRANHMLITPKRNYHQTTNSHHRFHKHKNLVSELEIKAPEQVWVADITYVGNRSNHAYLALITDAYSKKIMGYDLSDSLAVEGSLRALKMALKQRIYKQNPLIHHSDRGLQYCCNDYQKQLQKNKLVCSMTESYDPYANAVAERVNGILKDEFLLEQYRVDLKTLQKITAESIYLYNDYRPHLSCNMLTPNQMHCQKELKMRTYKKIATSVRLT
jgi:putative transposase